MQTLLKFLWALAPALYDPMCPVDLDLTSGKGHLQGQGQGHSRPFTILVEGNVGSGKSTTLSYFRQNVEKFDIDVVFEPVSQWQNVSGTDLLDLMFKDPKRWSGAFQMYSSLTRYRNIFAETRRKYRIMERSIFSERYCFLETMHDNPNGISDIEYDIMTRWFSLMTKKFWDKVKPDLIVYVRADIDILKERIRHRARPEERNIDPAFLAEIQRRHEDYLVNRNTTFPAPPAPVLVLDGNLPLNEFLEYLKTKVDQILGKKPVD